MTYWHYSASKYINGRDINFCGVIKSENQFFPLKKVMQTHLLVVGQVQTTISNAIEISEEDYNYFTNFAHNVNTQMMSIQMNNSDS